MKKYSVQTGWKNKGRTPEFKGVVQVFAINRQVGELATLVDHVGLNRQVKYISATDSNSLSLMPKIPTNIMCGSKLLIAN